MCCRSCRSSGPLRGQCLLTGGESWAAYFDVASACFIVGSWIVGWPAFLNLHEKWPFVVQKMPSALFLAQVMTWQPLGSRKNQGRSWRITCSTKAAILYEASQHLEGIAQCGPISNSWQHWFSFPHVPRLGWRERKKTALADDGITSIVSCNLSLQPLHFPW